MNPIPFNILWLATVSSRSLGLNKWPYRLAQSGASILSDAHLKLFPCSCESGVDEIRLLNIWGVIL